MFVRELHNILVSDPNDGGLKEVRDEENNIIISSSTLRMVLPPQLIQISAQYMVMRGCECCISDQSIYALLISWRDQYLKKLKYQIQNAQNRGSGEKANRIYEIYKNTVIQNRPHIYAKASNIEKVEMCAYN